MDIRSLLVQCSSVPVAKEIDGLGTVHIRRMTLGEADEMQQPVPKNGVNHSNSMRLLARFIGDEQGAPVFDLAKPDDVNTLKAIPVKVAAKILEAGNEVNVPPKDEKKD